MMRSASGSSKTFGSSSNWCAARRNATRKAVRLGRGSVTRTTYARSTPSTPLLDHAGAGDVVEPRKLFPQVGVALARDPVLHGTRGRRTLALHAAVLVIQAVEHFDAFDDLRNGRKAIRVGRVEPGVVHAVEKELRRARVRAAARERHHPAHVRLAHGVVGNGLALPRAVHRGVAAEPELRDEPANRAVERDGIEIVVL